MVKSNENLKQFDADGEDYLVGLLNSITNMLHISLFRFQMVVLNLKAE